MGRYRIEFFSEKVEEEEGFSARAAGKNNPHFSDSEGVRNLKMSEKSPSFAELKKKALAVKEVREEYERLKPVYQIKKIDTGKNA